MSAITTHVLDTSAGKPASGVEIRLDVLDSSGAWQLLGTGATNRDGRLNDLLPDDHKLVAGTYRLTFETAAYFSSRGAECFYPFVAVVFAVTSGAEHYHVPILLSPYGYSTYRGS